MTEAASGPGGVVVATAFTQAARPFGPWSVAGAIAAAAGVTDADTPPALRCCPNPLVWHDTLGWVHLATGLPLGRHPDDTTAAAVLAHADIAAALRAAANGTDLRVTDHPELPGASLTGPRGEAYLLAKPHGINVELWRHGGQDAYRVQRHTTLEAAVAIAVTAVADPPTHRVRHSRDPGSDIAPPRPEHPAG